MTPTELKQKYPEAVEMIDGLLSEAETHYFRPSKSVHALEGNEYHYNSDGLHSRIFPSLEMVVKYFFGTTQEEEEAETTIKEYFYNEYLSGINDAEVYMDEDNNVAFCDYTNNDFTEEELQKAREENNDNL